MSDRISDLRSILDKKNADAILLTSPVSIHYYTSFQGFALDEHEGFALVTKKKTYLLTSKLYEGAVQSLTNITPCIYSSEQPFTPLLKELLSKNSVHSLGVEANNLTLSEYIAFKKLAKIVPLQIRQLRIKKSIEEIELIKKSCQVADRAFEKVAPQVKAGMTEKQIAFLLETEIRTQGATTSFRPIVALGKNAAIPHHLTSDQRLKTNDLILIDFGAKVEGYCSDMTRTFFIGKPTEEQKKGYDTVLKAQEKAITFLTSHFSLRTSRSKGVNASRVDKIAREYIISQGYPTIPHSLGHGIGLEVHEPPYLGPGSNDLLEKGMVFSIEPGIYLPEKFGIRIEDLFAIENGKLLQLTNSPKF